MTAVILAGDVGGTKTHLGLFHIENGAPILLREHRYQTHDFASLEDVCADFLKRDKGTTAVRMLWGARPHHRGRSERHQCPLDDAGRQFGARSARAGAAHQ